MKNGHKSTQVTVEVHPPSPPDYRGKMALSKMAHVREELARLYREARTGKVNIQDATRLAYLLQVLAKVIESNDLEKRIDALEKMSQHGAL